MDTIVTFETAKLLKEKKFSEEVLFYYNDEGEECVVDSELWFGASSRDYFKNHNKWGDRFSAPTQTTLWKWMREKGIEVCPPLPYGDKWACSFIKTEDTQLFGTWEEALENELYNKLKL